MPNYLPFQGAENVSVPNDLNSEMPVQRFAFGGIANPSQQPFLSKADREYLEGKQADLERLAAYDRAVEAYNRDVYTPYEKAYGEYEKSINAWNEGPRTEDYAGPAAPELAPFTVAKPEVSFDPQAVVEFQKAAARRAQEAAAQRGLAIDVVSDPSKYNLGSLSVASAFMAKGGEVKAKDMLRRVAKAGRNGDTKLAYLSPSARDMLKGMGGAGTINPKTGLPEYFASVLRPISNQVAAVIAASNLPPPAATSAAATPASATPPSAAAATSTTPRSPVSPLVETPGVGAAGQKGLSGSPIPTGVSPVPTFNFGSLIRGATTPSQPTRQAPTVAPPAATQPAPDSRREDLIVRGGPALIKPISGVGGRESEYAPIKSPDGQKFYSGGQWWDNSPVSNQPLPSPTTNTPPVNSSPNMGAPIFLPQPNQSPPSDFVGPPLPPKQSQPPVAQPPKGANPNQALAERVLQMAVKKITPDLQYDTNGDGRITSADALAVSKGWKPSTPPLSGPGTDYPPLPPDFVGPRLPGQETPRQPTVPSPILPPAPAPAPTPVPPKPVARGMPGTRPYIPVMTYQGPTAVDLLQQNPSLAPQPLGGQRNMGYMTDRLGNMIRSPMMPRPVFAFARGGDVSTDALLQRVNEYNLYGDDPEYYSESRNMLQEMPGMSETRYSETPSTKTVKKITKRPLEAKSSEGFGKGMAMEVESLTTSKGTSPKALKGTAKDDFMELARTYKLKAREAENMARGLSRDTFNAPTLEKPSLTKGSLTKRRFEEGGEVKKSSEESEKEARPQYDDPFRSGKPLQQRTRRRATQEENEALSRAVAQGVANMPYNLVGAPVDLANMLLTPAGLGSERPVMGSEWIKQKMTDLGVRPEPPTDPTQRALYSAADIGSSLVNPAAPVRAAARGAEKAGEAARMLAEDFQQYNRALGPAGASYVIKPKGGNWLKGPVEEQLAAFKSDEMTAEEKSLLEDIAGISNKPGPRPYASQWQVDNAIRRLEDEPKNVALNQWIDRNLTNYVKKEMGTVDDPVRLLAEQGIVAKNLQLTPGMSLAQKRTTAGMPPAPVSQTAQGQAWEDLTDRMIDPRPASFYKNDKSFNEGDDELLAIQNPWIYKLPDETQVYTARGLMRNFGFDHVVDVLREDLASGRIRPEQLNKVSMDQAVRRTFEYDQELIAKANAARASAREGLPVYKEYPEKFRWIELNRPGSFVAESEAMGHSVRGYEPPKGHPDWIEASERFGNPSYGHGGWEAIKSGRAKVYSLVDEKGEPHVTIEVGSTPGISQDQAAKQARAEGLRGQAFAERVVELMEGKNDLSQITQIKGKSNAAPKEKYLPFVQDFVRSGNWESIGDLQNAGLVSVTEGQRLPGFSKTIPPGLYSLDELRQMAVENEMPQDILDTWMSKLGDQLQRGYAQGGLVDTSTAKGQLAKLKAA